MSYIDSNGTCLFAESTGAGTPIIFVHEFAGDLRNWEPQVRFFSRDYRCITFNARGYPPSDVPTELEHYTQANAVEDIANVLRYFEVSKAHVVGLSMGGYAALNFGIAHPEMTLSIAAAGAGHGSNPSTREEFLMNCTELADRMIQFGMQYGAADYLNGPTRRRFNEKDPRGCSEFKHQFTEHSALGSALTTRGVQLRRPTLYELKDLILLY